MQKIDTIVFDLGGVLVDWNPENLFRKIFETEEEVQHFLNEICTYEWNAEQDAGRTIEEANRILIQQYPDFEEEIRAYYGRWVEMFGPNLQGTIDILDQLVKNDNYRVLALTNWSAETWPTALELFPFFQWFEGILVSGHENMKKPERRIYQLLCDRFNVDKTKAVFFDDSLKNVKGAQEFGLHAFQFISPEQLREELKQYGVVV